MAMVRIELPVIDRTYPQRIVPLTATLRLVLRACSPNRTWRMRQLLEEQAAARPKGVLHFQIGGEYGPNTKMLSISWQGNSLLILTRRRLRVARKVQHALQKLQLIVGADAHIWRWPVQKRLTPIVKEMRAACEDVGITYEGSDHES